MCNASCKLYCTRQDTQIAEGAAEASVDTHQPAAMERVLDSTKGVFTHGLGSSCFEAADISWEVVPLEDFQ